MSQDLSVELFHFKLKIKKDQQEYSSNGQTLIMIQINDGFSNEKDFVKKLNSDKNHRYWKILFE